MGVEFTGKSPWAFFRLIERLTQVTLVWLNLTRTACEKIFSISRRVLRLKTAKLKAVE